jgi:hypothetical protein
VTGHQHKWVKVWDSYRAGWEYQVPTREVYRCAVKRCSEMGYSVPA